MHRFGQRGGEVNESSRAAPYARRLLTALPSSSSLPYAVLCGIIQDSSCEIPGSVKLQESPSTAGGLPCGMS